MALSREKLFFFLKVRETWKINEKQKEIYGYLTTKNLRWKINFLRQRNSWAQWSLKIDRNGELFSYDVNFVDNHKFPSSNLICLQWYSRFSEVFRSETIANEVNHTYKRITMTGGRKRMRNEKQRDECSMNAVDDSLWPGLARIIRLSSLSRTRARKRAFGIN